MSTKDCFVSLKKQLPEVPDRVLKAFVEELRFRKNTGDFRKASKEFIKEVELHTQREVLAKKHQILAKQRIRNHFDQFKKFASEGEIAEALKSLLVGTHLAVKESRVSSERISRTQYYHWARVMDHGIKKIEPTLFERLVSGEHQDDLIRELHAMENVDDAKMVTKNKEAFEAAKVFRGIMKDIPVMFRRVGVDMGTIRNYLPQVHNNEKMRAAGFEKWAEDAKTHFDMKKAFGEKVSSNAKDLDAALRKAYDDMITGRDKMETLPGTSDLVVSYQNISNEGAQLSKERTFFAKSAEDHIAYNSKYGNDRPFVAEIDTYLKKRSRAYGLIKQLGPNHEATFRVLLGDEKGTGQLEKQLGQKLSRTQKLIIRNIYAELTGRTMRPAESMLGKAVAVTNKVTDITSLGSAGFSQATDLPISVGVLAGKTGANPFKLAHESMLTFMKNLVPKNREKILRNLAIGLESEMVNDFSRLTDTVDSSRLEQANGWLTWAHRRMFDLNGMALQTKASRSTVAQMFSMELFDHADTRFHALDPRLKQTLEGYGISPIEWDAIRQARDEFPGGHGGLLPESLHNIDEKTMVNLHRASGDKSTMEAWRLALEQKFMSALGDMAETGAPNPGARTAALTKWGYTPDDVPGMALSLIAKYKGIQHAVYQSLMAIKTSDPGSTATGLMQLRGDNKTLAATVVSMTVMGYMINVARSAFHGKDMPTPDNAHDLKDAFVRGGAAGIYGDFLFTDYSGNYRDWARDVLGPTGGNIAQSFELISKTQHALMGTDKRYHFGAGKMGGQGMESEYWNFAKRNIPFQNLFFTKYAFDRLIDDNVQNYLAPGTTRRRDARERREKKNQKR